MGEDPLGYVAPLLPRLHVRKAEVGSLIDAGVDHVCGGIREPVTRAHLHWWGTVMNYDHCFP